MNNQLTELLTNYGPIGAIWFDGWWDQDANPDFDWQLPEQYALIHDLLAWWVTIITRCLSLERIYRFSSVICRARTVQGFPDKMSVDCLWKLVKP